MVADFTRVEIGNGVALVVISRRGRNGNTGLQQILGVLIVIIEGHGQFVVKKTQVHTDIILGRALPLQVVQLHGRWSDGLVLNIFTHCRIRTHIRSGTTGSLTALTDTGPELTLLQPVQLPQKAFFLSVPGNTKRGKKAPAVGLTQAGFALVIEGGVDNIAVEQGVVETTYARQGSDFRVTRSKCSDRPTR
ncbi:MAG: hypothetical protein BWY72_02103 [Bacteroidetes bacterium ADurb.Bin416]|nr:MAG: hypothetical protein BWY72_02103 [Bacteroidetes bacterium ADurb.Bin416]